MFHKYGFKWFDRLCDKQQKNEEKERERERRNQHDKHRRFSDFSRTIFFFAPKNSWTNSECTTWMFLRNGHYYCRSCCCYYLFMFYKMTYGNEVLPRHLPFTFLRWFVVVFQVRLNVFAHLFESFLINTKICTDKISRFIRNFREGRKKCWFTHNNSTQIPWNNRLIHVFMYTSWLWMLLLLLSAWAFYYI